MEKDRRDGRQTDSGPQRQRERESEEEKRNGLREEGGEKRLRVCPSLWMDFADGPMLPQAGHRASPLF